MFELVCCWKAASIHICDNKTKDKNGIFFIFWNSFRKRLHLFWSLLSMLSNFRFSPLGTALRLSFPYPFNWRGKIISRATIHFRWQKKFVSTNVKCIHFDSVSLVWVWTGFQSTWPHKDTHTYKINTNDHNKDEKSFSLPSSLEWNAIRFKFKCKQNCNMYFSVRMYLSKWALNMKKVERHVPFGIRFPMYQLLDTGHLFTSLFEHSFYFIKNFDTSSFSVSFQISDSLVLGDEFKVKQT